MAVHRIKHNFTAGEISPLMAVRDDFERFKNGSKTLRNMIVRTQGPCTRRPGSRFIYNLSDLNLSTTEVDDDGNLRDPYVRLVDFVFNEVQSYAMVFYESDTGPQIVFGTGEGLVTSDGNDCVFSQSIEVDYDTAPIHAYDFTIADTGVVSALTVTHVSEANVSTQLTLATDYTVAYVGNVGTITTVANTTTNALSVVAGSYIRMDATVGITGATLGDIIALPLVADFDISEFDYAQSGDYLYMSQRGLKPHAAVRHTHYCWELVEIEMTNEPSDWSDLLGWPETVTLHQQRLMFGGSYTRRQTIWASAAGDFHDFTTGTTEADAIIFTLDSGTQNRIQWLHSGKALGVGTLGNEWTVVGGTMTAMTPTNILSLRQTNNGSERIKPLMIGLATIFIEYHGRVVNEFVYDYTYDSYKTSDITILAPHLTDDYSITDWAYQQTPDSIIWCVRSDGALIALTYQRAHKVVGWHKHDTKGSYVTCCTIPGDNREDDLWTVVKRFINGAEQWYIEKFDDRFLGEDTIDARFLDSFKVYDDLPTTTISGLDHLEDQTVSILADGSVYPDQIVVGGQISLDYEVSKACIGLSYLSEVRPLLVDLDMQDGTSDGRMQRITDIEVMLHESVGMTLGREDPESGEHLEEIPFRKPYDSTGEPVPLYTGTIHINFPEGYSRETEYFIRQEQPLPLTVLGVVDVVEATK